ncbi:hypothetical protein [Streptomyces sp. GbtcB6]|nr:hypothetical protein [Streptomyces sp. GbtcB6]
MSSSQKNGVDAVSTTAATVIVMFLGRDTPLTPFQQSKDAHLRRMG